MRSDLKKTQQGALLIEVLVSIAFAAMATLTISTLMVSNVKTTRAAIQESQATAVAKEAMERVYAAKRESWVNIKDLNGNYVVVRNGNTVEFNLDPAATGEVVGDFQRFVNITTGKRNAAGKLDDTAAGVDVDDQVKLIKTTVRWTAPNNTPRELTLTGYLTNWKGEGL